MRETRLDAVEGKDFLVRYLSEGLKPLLYEQVSARIPLQSGLAACQLPLGGIDFGSAAKYPINRKLADHHDLFQNIDEDLPPTQAGHCLSRHQADLR